MLMNHANLQRIRILGRTDNDLAAIHVDMTLVGIINAGKHVHQRRLAAAVFTQNGQNFAPVYIQVYGIIRNDTAKRLGDAAHAQCDLFLHSLPPNHMH